MHKGAVKNLLEYISPQKGVFSLVVLFSLLTVFFQIIIPIQIGRAINMIVGINQVNFTEVWRQILWLAAFAFSAAVFQFLQNEATNRLTYNMMYSMRRNLFEKIHKLPLSFVDRHSYGDIVSRVINDVDLVGNGLLQSFTSLFTGIATILGVIVMMLSLNVGIGMIVILLTPLSVIVSTFIANRTYRYFQEQVELRGELGGYVDEMSNQQYLVKGFQYENRSRERFDDINSRLHESGIWSQFYGALINPTARVINSMVYAAVGIFGSFAVIRGNLTVGIFSSFLTYAHQFSKPFNEISSVINEMQTAFAALERINYFLKEEEAEPSRDNQEISGQQGNIAIDHLYFSYVPARPLIQDFSVHVQAGDTVAIVGPTGAGKSTLINLLMRFYDQDEGRIIIDGVDTLDMNRHYLRRLFGMVLQDSWIFEGTVRENIMYGKPDASMDEVREAAEKARVHHLIEQMDRGYETLLEENGSNLSSGQKQLICIARIMLTDPGMLILDEATSSIDTMTEQAVQKSFDDMMEGRTTFIVAHRLSTIQKADTILVLEQGQIVEQGSHEELLEKQGYYYNLYQSQFDNSAA